MCHIWLYWNVLESMSIVCLAWPCLALNSAVCGQNSHTRSHEHWSVTRSSAIRTKRRCKTNPNCSTKRSNCKSNWKPQMKMESPPESVTVPRKSAEAGASVEDSPVKLDSKAETDKPAPVRRQSCSSTNRGKLEEQNQSLLVDYFQSYSSSRRSNFEFNKLQSLHVTCFTLALN